MTLSSYPFEIRSIFGHDIEISVMMVAPPWSSRYDNVGKVRAVLNGIEVGNSGQRSLPGGGSPVNIIFSIPGNAIPVGTHTIVLATELRYENEWYNAGDYNVPTIIDSGPGIIIPGSSNIIIIVIAVAILYYFFMMRGK